jgi:hypothetical protein
LGSAVAITKNGINNHPLGFKTSLGSLNKIPYFYSVI